MLFVYFLFPSHLEAKLDIYVFDAAVGYHITDQFLEAAVRMSVVGVVDPLAISGMADWELAVAAVENEISKPLCSRQEKWVDGVWVGFLLQLLTLKEKGGHLAPVAGCYS